MIRSNCLITLIIIFNINIIDFVNMKQSCSICDCSLNLLLKDKIPVFYRFLAKNTRLSTLSGFKHVLLSVTMLPPVLNILSELTLVAQTHRYFLANFAKLGNLVSSVFHHSNGHM